MHNYADYSLNYLVQITTLHSLIRSRICIFIENILHCLCSNKKKFGSVKSSNITEVF